jgi:hypothetical protein
MILLKKLLLGVVAGTALLATTPAQADWHRDRDFHRDHSWHHRDHDRVER